MRFSISSDLSQLATFIPRFIELVGRERWFRRVDQLDLEQKSSPFLWKIVSDYHWLEMAISSQAEIVNREGHLVPKLMDPLALAALHFAAAVVEIQSRSSNKAQHQLLGRLRDALKAKSGFAALYLEVDLALKLMADGFDVQFPDLDEIANYDIQFSKDDFIGEVECKSLSSDAGRQIHRKDFYRFMEAMKTALVSHAELNRKEVIEVILEGRFSPNDANQAELRRATVFMLGKKAPPSMSRKGFRIHRHCFDEVMEEAPFDDHQNFHSFCSKKFGPNPHIAGGVTETGGCLIVMRSKREDDTSKPWLAAMRKAASQFSGEKPSFIAIQFQEISAHDLMSIDLRRRAGILSYALYHHYKEAHINATYISGFAATVAYNGELGSPAFAVPNREPKFPVEASKVAPFLRYISDKDFAASIGAPPPESDITNIKF